MCFRKMFFSASDVSMVDYLDELEVYGVSENPTGTTITSFVFEVKFCFVVPILNH